MLGGGNLNKFFSVEGENCLLDLIGGYIRFKNNKNIDTSFLYLATTELEFSYESIKEQGLLYPKVSLFKKRNYDELKTWFSINIDQENSINRSRAYNLLIRNLNTDIATIIVGEGKILSQSLEVPLSYFVIYSPANYTNLVNISGVYFNGQITINEVLDLMEKKKTSTPLNFTMYKLKVDSIENMNLKIYYHLFCERLKSYSVKKESYLQFKADIYNFNSLPIVLLRKILAKSLSEQLFHPWGPVTCNKNYLKAVKILNEAQLISFHYVELFESIYNDWVIIRSLLEKYSLKPDEKILERIIKRIDNLYEKDIKLYQTIKEGSVLKIGEQI